jgi:hypothetical protein
MTAQHTPGPWWTDGVYSEDEGGVAIIAASTDCGPLPGNPTRGMVAFATELLAYRADECIANARLIAAAPETAAERDRLRAINADLLAALRNAVRIVDFYMKSLGVEPADIQESLAPARAAIARAEGREP